MAGRHTDSISRKEIEALLRGAFVPIEPSPRFVHRLKARLVRYRGAGTSRIWAAVGGVAIGIVVVMAVFGLALRLFLGLLSVIGLLERDPPSRQRSTTTA
ncbi:MAG: hypothetical protein WBR18_11330 [Anaerolineales bacterium]